MESKKSYFKPMLVGTVWKYVSLYAGRLVNVIGLMILARVLLKEDFGVAAYATVVLTFIDFPGLGVGQALIYYPRDAKRTNTAFWLVLIFGVILTAFMYLGAPLAGMYFRDERAIPVVRALSVYFLFVAVGVVPSAVLTKNLSFRKKFYGDFAGDISKAVVGISLALMGFGAFSIIAGNLISTLATTIVLWLIWKPDWRPSFSFDKDQVRPIIRYSVSIMGMFAFAILINNADYLIVGRYLGATALGVYMLGFQIPRLVIKQFYSALSEVIFPVFSRMREESSHMGEGFLNTIRYTSMLTVPMAVGLCLVADPLVRTLFGDKWVDAIPITAAIAIYTLIGSLYFASGDVFKAQGRPEIVTKMHIFNLIVLIPALYWAAAIYGSLVAVGWMQVAVVLLVGAVRTVVAGRLLHFSMLDFVKVLMPTLVASAIMAAAVQVVMTVTTDVVPLVRLIAGIATGGLAYTLAILWLQRDLIVQAQKTIRGVFARV